MSKFVLQAHFRRQSVHYDLRIQHPKFPDLFFGYTIFIDKGKLEDEHLSVEDVDTAKDVIANFHSYFKSFGNVRSNNMHPWDNKRMGITKSFGSIKWLDVNGIIPKHLKDTTYNQVMLILNKGTCSIFEDRLYSMKISFDDVTTMNGAPDILGNQTFIFRYIDSLNQKSPFYLLSWSLKDVEYSNSEYIYIDHVTDTFEIYETNAGEIMGHYLMKDSKGNWYTVDRDPVLSTKFIYIKDKYPLSETNKIDTTKLSFDILKSNKEKKFYVAIK